MDSLAAELSRAGSGFETCVPGESSRWLKRLFRSGKLVFAGQLADLADWKGFSPSWSQCARKSGSSTPKRRSAAPITCCTTWPLHHRVAISNHRLIAFDGESVTFRWKDYAHGNKKRKMTVSAEEFLRRFLLHTLPRGFVRIRFFGFWPDRGAPRCCNSPGNCCRPNLNPASRRRSGAGFLPVSGLRHPDGLRRTALRGATPPRRRPPECAQRFLVADSAT